MQLQTKISLAIPPLVALTIFVLGAWAVITATTGIQDAMYRIMEKEEIVRTEYDRGVRTLEVYAFPILDDSDAPSGVVECIRDISERKRMHIQIEERNRALEAGNRELDDFAYIASHDLREPLRGIANFSRFLLEDYEDVLDPDGVAKIDTLIRLCRMEESLIDSLLQYSRIARTELNRECVDMRMLLEEVKERLSSSFNDAGIDVRIPAGLPNAYCDRVQVREVLYNFLTNSLKYNDKDHKPIEIEDLMEAIRRLKDYWFEVVVFPKGE